MNFFTQHKIIKAIRNCPDIPTLYETDFSRTYNLDTVKYSIRARIQLPRYGDKFTNYQVYITDQKTKLCTILMNTAFARLVSYTLRKQHVNKTR